ncbi:hypothetical protein SFUMM280S_10087 [Streptomyces fumanus]
MRMSTRVRSPAAVMRRVASMPSRPGMRTSMRTTSGGKPAVMRTASLPSAASPRTVMFVLALQAASGRFETLQGLIVGDEHGGHCGGSSGR